MQKLLNRREWMHRAAGACTLAGVTMLGRMMHGKVSMNAPEPLYRISLAQWSLHRALKSGKIDNLDFPVIARKEFDLEAVEYVNVFFMDKAADRRYLAELKKRCEDHEVRSLLIMCDGEGNLGDADEKQRRQAVENHHRWVTAAKFLGCYAIRVNARSSGSFEEQQQRAADGLRQLAEFAAAHDMNVLVENHGGLSSHGGWLAGVMKMVNLPNCGTLPDFGNFNLGDGKTYDRYQGVREMMPYAKAVSAKAHQFDDQGNETATDYVRMMGIVLEHGYHGYVGIEWEGDQPDEYEGIRRTKRLLERVRMTLAASQK